MCNQDIELMRLIEVREEQIRVCKNLLKANMQRVQEIIDTEVNNRYVRASLNAELKAKMREIRRDTKRLEKLLGANLMYPDYSDPTIIVLRTIAGLVKDE